QKRAVLAELLSGDTMKQIIVFARTKHGADRVTRDLERDGFAAAVIHGNKSQNARQKALNDFRAGKVRILVATDIAARGIDVPGISHVVNFDLPDEAESYVHRIGRTGRNGAEGEAITLCDPAETSKLRQVERLIRQKLTVAKDITGAPMVEGETREKREEARPARGAARPKFGQGKKSDGVARPKFGQPKRDGDHGGAGRPQQKRRSRPAEGQRRTIRAA